MSSSAIHHSGGHESSAHTGFRGLLSRRFSGLIDRVAPCPWTAHTGQHSVSDVGAGISMMTRPLYTPEERVRRDNTIWTLVQGILAPVQFLAFGISCYFVIHYLATGEGAASATVSVLVKTMLLYTIMVTGAIWEMVVFGRYLFAPSFFWEDVFSMLVLALHTAYLGAVLLHVGTPREQLLLALAAYATYVINAAQFIWKLRMARLEAPAKNTMVAA